jgi:hypothetical protein
MLCKAMKFNHLPMAGGIYDQHPGLIDRFYYLLAQEAKVEGEEARRREAEAKNPKKPGGRFSRRR